MPDLIYRIGELLFEQSPGQLIRLEQLHQALPDCDAVTIGEALERMRTSDLVETTFQRDAVRLSPQGRETWNEGSIVEVARGMQYVAARYGPATVHIIVRREGGEFGGSGFFSADYQDCIVTAAHVASLELVRIIFADGVIALPPFEKIIPPDGLLDLALIRCTCPRDVNRIRIEWGRDRTQAMDQLLVLGYPPLPNLMPNLDHVRAEVRQIGRTIRDQRDSIVLSSTTLPGSSGGPVLSKRGRAVGVVDQENIGDHLGHTPVRSFTATPAYYLEDVLRPE